MSEQDAIGVIATESALQLIAEIRSDHGPLLFHISGGCCDGSSPMCYPAGEFRIGASDIQIGAIDDIPVYIGRDQHERWQHTELIFDAVPGRGGMFSLDNGRERRFLIRSKLTGGAIGIACGR